MLAFIPFFLWKSGIKNQNHNLQEENSSLFSYSLSFWERVGVRACLAGSSFLFVVADKHNEPNIRSIAL
jgi:hypothetical protein